jgi:hypothetical protein
MIDAPDGLKHIAHPPRIQGSFKDLCGTHPIHSGAAAIVQFALSGVSPYSWFDHCCMSALALHIAVQGCRRGPFKVTLTALSFSPHARRLVRATAVNSLPPVEPV